MDQCPLPEYDRTGGRLIITSPYGPRSGSVHFGIDWGSTDGIEMVETYPVVPGKVVSWRRDPGMGAGLNLWFVGDDGSRWKYFHLSEVFIPLVGFHVDLTTPIARIGNSGTSAVHLHLEKHQVTWSNPVNFNDDARRCLAERRFPGTVVAPPPAPERPAPVEPAPNPTNTELWPMPLVILYFADKDTRWLLGSNDAGPWCRQITYLAEMELLQARGVPARELGAGNDELDRLFHDLTGL